MRRYEVYHKATGSGVKFHYNPNVGRLQAIGVESGKGTKVALAQEAREQLAKCEAVGSDHHKHYGLRSAGEFFDLNGLPIGV